MCDAPSVELIEGLLGKGARVQCHDPMAMQVAQRYFGNLMKAPITFDGRNAFEPTQMREEGFTCFGIGQP